MAGSAKSPQDDVQAILRNADELAARFESYEPDPADEIDPRDRSGPA